MTPQLPASNHAATTIDEMSGYQPSFRETKKPDSLTDPANTAQTATKASGKKLPLKFGKKKAYPWETNILVFPQKKLGNEQCNVVTHLKRWIQSHCCTDGKEAEIC